MLSVTAVFFNFLMDKLPPKASTKITYNKRTAIKIEFNTLLPPISLLSAICLLYLHHRVYPKGSVNLINKYLFSIGEVSKIKNITVKALRFYDRIGLIKPYFTDPDTKYRYYHINQFIYFDIIKAARSMDISPNDLIPYFANNDSTGLYHLINEYKKTLDSKIKNLKKAIDSINEVTNTMDIAQKVDKSGSIYRRNIPDRHVIAVPFDFEKSHEDILTDFMLLDASVNRRGLVNCFEQGVIYSQSNTGIIPEYIFTCVQKKVVEVSDYRYIPGGEYVCTVLNGSNAQQQVEELLDYLDKNGLNAQFFIQIELLLDLFATESDLFELQAKV